MKAITHFSGGIVRLISPEVLPALAQPRQSEKRNIWAKLASKTLTL